MFDVCFGDYIEACEVVVADTKIEVQLVASRRLWPVLSQTPTST